MGGLNDIPGPFDLYIGIDWSGAKTEVLPNMVVARASAGGGAPALVDGPLGGKWSRAALMDWLLELAGSGERVLCGADFSFCFPYVDRDAYFPGVGDEPASVRDMWDTLNTICVNDPHLRADSFLAHPEYGAHFFSKGKGRDRLRTTEQACRDQGFGKPETVFKIVGPKQVAKSSLTGMRVLHKLKSQPENVAVWPFDDVEDATLVFVETYPAAFVRMAGEGAGKVRDGDRLARVLGYFNALPSCHPRFSPSRSQDFAIAERGRRDDKQEKRIDDNEADALVSAAALRALSTDSGLWNPPSLSDRVRRTEGWTFGIR